jgi:glutamate formiminotransferase
VLSAEKVASLSQMSRNVCQLATTAAAVLPGLQHHEAAHPRLGIIDHISVHPLGPACDLNDASTFVRSTAEALSLALPDLPIILYGEVSSNDRLLRDIRLACGMLLAVCACH